MFNLQKRTSDRIIDPVSKKGALIKCAPKKCVPKKSPFRYSTLAKIAAQNYPITSQNASSKATKLTSKSIKQQQSSSLPAATILVVAQIPSGNKWKIFQIFYIKIIN